VYSFKTIHSPAEGIYKEKGSKFLAFAHPVETEADIRTLISGLQKKYHDARHHCYAWMLGTDKKLFRAFDDGEPNHSAGDPILNQIRSKELTNILVVVVRYFGGIKLGVGGLITAYKSAAADALNKALIVEKEVMGTAGLAYDYKATPEIMKLVSDFGLKIVSQDFAHECRVVIAFKQRDENELFEKITLLQNTGTAVKVVKGQ
jgi:uncharacterized YigZ family protein